MVCQVIPQLFRLCLEQLLRNYNLEPLKEYFLVWNSLYLLCLYRYMLSASCYVACHVHIHTYTHIHTHTHTLTHTHTNQPSVIKGFFLYKCPSFCNINISMIESNRPRLFSHYCLLPLFFLRVISLHCCMMKNVPRL